MDVSILGAASEAFVILMDPFRMLMLASGVVMGLMLGLIPGIGGLAGLAILMPFTYAMDSYAAFAMLLGMLAVTNTSDTIPAVMFGVPGSAAAQATVMDGNPMAKKGEAGRALSAAFTASLIGGLFGALILGIAIPVLRPFVLSIGSPELLAFSVFGISMVAVLSGNAPLRGLIAAGIGILLAMVGTDPQSGGQRWTLSQIYLLEGVPLLPLVLGLFALPELADMVIRRRSIADNPHVDTRSGMLQGIRDVFANWWLTLRCGALGAIIGAVPGVSGNVIDWLAYSHAAQTVKGASKTFGKGDVRGVIAPESANNSINAGTLVPTIAFGVPGSAGMAIILSIFLVHGLTPGPNMLTTNLSFTYTLVWSIAIANILGAGICFAFSNQLARLSQVRYSLIIPVVLAFVFLGAFQTTRSWGDLVALLIFAVIGWTMKRLRWPRPPLILGFVLGDLIERYLVISTARYGWDWLGRPVVAILLILSLIIMIDPLVKRWKALGGASGIRDNLGRPKLKSNDLAYVFVVGFAVWLFVMTQSWPAQATTGPIAIIGALVGVAVVSLIYQTLSRTIVDARVAAGEAQEGLHMDMTVDDGDIDRSVMLRRAATFGGYLFGTVLLMTLVGMLPAIAMTIVAFMWLEGREKPKTIAIFVICIIAVVFVIFDQILRVPWPSSFLGQLVPALRVIPTM